MKHELIREDIRTDAWRRLTKTLSTELQRLRELNDVPSKDAVETALIRGQISAIKEILDLSKDSSGDAASPATPVMHQVGELSYSEF